VNGRCCSVVTWVFAKKSLTKSDRCAGALSCRRNQLLVLHFSGHFLLTASLRRRKMSVYISLLTVTIPLNYTSEIQDILKPLHISFALYWKSAICSTQPVPHCRHVTIQPSFPPVTNSVQTMVTNMSVVSIIFLFRTDKAQASCANP